MKTFDKEKSIRHILSKPGQSAYKKYKALVAGDVGFINFFSAELVFFFLSSLGGAVGILLRKIIYPRLFKQCGSGIIIGRNCTFRHPSILRIGNHVTIDDNCLLDARGTGQKGIVLHDKAIINRGTTIQSKSGDIEIGKSVAIGANSSLVSWDGIKIGDGVAIAAGCYISAGDYDTSDLNTPVIEQEAITKGPIIIEDNVWIATRVTILDGVQIGRDSIIYAGSVVTENIPQRSIVHGNPAKVIFNRR
jgi:acetyltransferase-like isoleucine patch superfamily enzyme